MVVIWSVITDQLFRSVIWSIIWLFLVVIDCYCWSQYNRRLAIQFTHCTTKLQYNSFPTAIYLLVTIHLCIAIQFFHCTPLYCNTIFSSLHHHIAIQFSAHCTTILQYNFLANMHSLAIQFSSCNTLTQPTCKPHCNTIPCIDMQFSSLTSLVAI